MALHALSLLKFSAQHCPTRPFRLLCGGLNAPRRRRLCRAPLPPHGGQQSGLWVSPSLHSPWIPLLPAGVPGLSAVWGSHLPSSPNLGFVCAEIGPIQTAASSAVSPLWALCRPPCWHREWVLSSSPWLRGLDGRVATPEACSWPACVPCQNYSSELFFSACLIHSHASPSSWLIKMSCSGKAGVSQQRSCIRHRSLRCVSLGCFGER